MGLFRRTIPKTDYRELELMLEHTKTPEDLNRLKKILEDYEEKGYSMEEFKDKHEEDIKTFEYLFREDEKIK